MIDSNILNPKSPKFHIKKYLEGIRSDLVGKCVMDIPAGNGVTSELLLEMGANVEAFDLFPEYFMLKDVRCNFTDVMQSIPVADNHADMIICQEGIEHFSDQLKVFKEFNRVLKMNGQLLITTPSYSNIRSRISYLLFESENFRKMPPNEIDDIWMSDKSLHQEIYHGHIFLIGLQKLRILATLAGFRISEVRYTRISKASVILFPFFYPFIFISSILRYFRCLRKHKDLSPETVKRIYNEQLKLNLHPANLLNHHTFMIFKKENELKDLDFRQESLVKPFGKIM